LLDGAERVGSQTAADVVALLDDDTLSDDVDLDIALRKVRGSQRWKRESKRLAAMVPNHTGRADPALVAALAYPERVARRRNPGSPVYLMAGGTAVELPSGTGLAEREWLAVAVADRQPGSVHGRIRLAAGADLDLATEAVGVSTVDEVVWRDGDVVARRVKRLGAITLAEQPLPNPDQSAVRAALLAGIREEGVRILHWTTTATTLRARLDLLHRTLGDPWPAVDDDSLMSTVDLSGIRNRAGLAKVSVTNTLRALLPWPAAARLDELAPERIEVPSGKHFTVDYTGERPVLAMKLQEAFGWAQVPAIADGRVKVLLHLLSPAGRPAAVTDDLESFWTNGYPHVRAELRGRYPKHDWPVTPQSPRRSPR
jgi:ATP-dependent helicase HrpB